MMSAPPVILPYEPRPKRPWLRPLLRWLRLLAVVLVALAVWRCYGSVVTKLRILYYQRQCMAFALPPATVVYEEDQLAQPALLARPGYWAWGPSSSPSTVNGVLFSPACWETVGMRQERRRLVNLAGPGSFLFMHERISPAGHRRLVLVQYNRVFAESCPEFANGSNWTAESISEATLVSDVSVLRYTYDGVYHGKSPITAPLVRIYAGQADPADASHFTIRYQMWGQTDVVDGWLRDDESVELVPRNPPREPGR